MFQNIQINIQHLLEKPSYQVAHKLIQKCFQEGKVDQTHGLKHVQQVVDNTIKALSAWKFLHQGQNSQLSIEYQELFQDILLASLLHDADDRKYFPTHQNLDNAVMILGKVFQSKEQANITERKKRVIEMINQVSFSKNGDKINLEKPLLYYYPRYADRIEAIGVKGLIRCYEYTKISKRPLFDEKTCRPKNMQELQNCIKGRQQQYIKRGGSSASFIDHIYDKLLHIKLPECIKQQNAFFACKFVAAYQQLADFILKNAANNFEDVQSQMQNLSSQ